MLIPQIAFDRDEWFVETFQVLPRADTLKHKIDAAVYRLYDLSAEEICVVEGKA